MSKIDAKPYIGVLENTFQYLEIFFGPLKTYQHDNALIFTARVISHGILSWLEWPPYSPEQNIIENLWSIRIGKIVWIVLLQPFKKPDLRFRKITLWYFMIFGQIESSKSFKAKIVSLTLKLCKYDKLIQLTLCVSLSLNISLILATGLIQMDQ